jgi:hypothetical protein
MQALPVSDWMEDRRLSLEDMIRVTGMEPRMCEAIACGRYTPTGEQRKLVADFLGVDVDTVFWGHVNQVDHVYGHGPQFGRSP